MHKKVFAFLQTMFNYFKHIIGREVPIYYHSHWRVPFEAVVTKFLCLAKPFRVNNWKLFAVN